MIRKFNVSRISRENRVKDAKTTETVFYVVLDEDSKVLNHFTFGLQLSEEEAVSLTLDDTFTLTLDGADAKN